MKAFGKDSSKVTLSTALIDSTGDYVLIDSIFVYDPLATYLGLTRYKIRFILDPFGSYVRQISDDNKLFYTYVSDLSANHTKELYSPYQTMSAPTAKQFGKAYAYLRLNEVLQVEGKISGSRFNNNTIGSNKPLNAISHLIKITSDTIDLEFLKFNLLYKNQACRNICL